MVQSSKTVSASILAWVAAMLFHTDSHLDYVLIVQIQKLKKGVLEILESNAVMLFLELFGLFLQFGFLTNELLFLGQKATKMSSVPAKDQREATVPWR